MAEISVLSGLGSSVIANLREPMVAIEKLIDALPSEADAHSYIWNDWKPIADFLITKKKRGTLKGPVVLIVHSQGQEGGAEIANAIAPHGITIDYFASISPTLGKTKPLGGNVLWVDEFYEAVSPINFLRIFGGGRVNYSGYFKGVRNKYTRLSGGHVGVAANPFVRSTIVNRVKALLEAQP